MLYKTRDEELRNLRFPSTVIKVIKKILIGHVASLRQLRNTYKIWSETFSEETVCETYQ
jgi:hypothetical protein